MLPNNHAPVHSGRAVRGRANEGSNEMKKLLPMLLVSTALVASPAYAKTAAADDSSGGTKVTIDKEYLDSIINRLNTVESELATVKAQQAATNSAAAQATAAAAQATQTASAAQTTAAAAQTAASKPPKVDLGWAGSTKISGKAYFNVSNIDAESTDLAHVTTKSGANGTQAELKRFYISVDHKFDSIFSANLTTDMRYGTNGTSNDVLVYVKKAYLQATLAPEFYVRIGSADLPWVPFVEGLYGYRFVENVMIDRDKFGTSADYGVHIGGTFANGLVSYAASAVNGLGYKTLARKSNTIDLEGRVSVNPVKNITLAVGGYTGKLGKSADNLPASAVPHTASRFDAIAAYTDKRIRAGVEYFAAKDWNNVTTVASDKSHGFSAFGSFAFTPKMAVFGRYDWVKPSRDLAPTLKDNYFNVGVDYKPIAPLDMALVYKRDRVDNGVWSTSNGSIGGADHGTYDEFGLWGQFAF